MLQVVFGAFFVALLQIQKKTHRKEDSFCSFVEENSWTILLDK
jgi:hypothetical protein